MEKTTRPAPLPGSKEPGKGWFFGGLGVRAHGPCGQPPEAAMAMPSPPLFDRHHIRVHRHIT